MPAGASSPPGLQTPEPPPWRHCFDQELPLWKATGARTSVDRPPATGRDEEGIATVVEVSVAPAGNLVPADDPVVVEATAVVQSGDPEAPDRLLRASPWLATARFGDADCNRTLLHAATDWRGHFPNGPTVVDRLIRAGADINAPSRFDSHTETPLHWAASSNDVIVLDALLDCGADINAPVPSSAVAARSLTPAGSETGHLPSAWSSGRPHQAQGRSRAGNARSG